MTHDAGRSAADIDVDALQRRYDEERRRRLRIRADELGFAEEPQLKGRFQHFDRDLYADPIFTRSAVTEDVEVLVIGGGMAGIMVAGRLREAGIQSIRIVEKGSDFGGTWYWNRYPGCACDVESYIYLPMLERSGYMPTERYAKGGEILAYLKGLAGRYALYDAALFQTLVSDARWDEGLKRWVVRTDRGDRIAARFVVSCTGVLSSPTLPTIPGIEDFAGYSFHTSRWDYAYTGGDETGNMTGLADKTVGIIGTGATAVQAIPHIARSARRLYVFQRTPSSIDERGNRPTDPDWFGGLKSGWQEERQENFACILSGIPQSVDLVNDGWTDISLSIARQPGDVVSGDAEDAAIARLSKMEAVRRRIASVVKDAATAEALKPYYNYFCKRPCFHDEYLDTFNRPNVTLVDTEGRGVERISAAGAVVADREYPLDCLIFATGFDLLADYTRESGLEAYGRGGVALSDHWKEGPRTLRGMQTDRFPNLFFIRLAQAGQAANYTPSADEQSRHITYVIEQCLAAGAATVEATPEAVEAWVEKVVEKAVSREAFLDGCPPSQYNYGGDPSRKRFAALSGLYGGGAIDYFNILRSIRSEKDLSGLSFGRRD